MPQKSNIIGTWSEEGIVSIWDISHHLKSLNQPNDHSTQRIKDKPIHSFSGHPQEGYAIDWSSVSEGKLATGDCTKYIYVWNPVEGGKWEVDLAPYVGHSDSVEDIQWSPTEAGVRFLLFIFIILFIFIYFYLYIYLLLIICYLFYFIYSFFLILFNLFTILIIILMIFFYFLFIYYLLLFIFVYLCLFYVKYK